MLINHVLTIDFFFVKKKWFQGIEYVYISEHVTQCLLNDNYNICHFSKGTLKASEIVVQNR